MPLSLESRKNELLAALTTPESTRWSPLLEAVDLPLGKVLYESGDAQHHLNFPTTAIVSLFALTVLVTPVHVYMLQQPELFAVPYWLLVLRLPVQVAFLALIAWSTFARTAR